MTVRDRRVAVGLVGAVLLAAGAAVCTGVRIGADGRPPAEYAVPPERQAEPVEPQRPVESHGSQHPVKPVEPGTAAPVPETVPPSSSRPTRTPPPVWGQKVIASTGVLTTGQSWATNRLRLTVTEQGDLVLRDQGRVVWRTGTTTGVKLVMQNDGHLVLYDAGNGTAWSSGTAGNPGAVLILRADGEMVVALGGRVLFRA
ncbi:hypothetical protein Aab01nite_50030 [Paractinoplanes abujensis]|uniref:Bulb-type lectin domain-containing protein n=1 Tax=Paractinoplanes abujensis TaxID=882441 RepID=A0A7W7CSJ9_9ACTN|nr:hypothetical protein [Actinoplanes abujensis]MBB4693931.1 hypothetical protein [Actinoplanes abujensis]GID21413.1 hypothetical protein Aab01nite_50030 [Actinoplanes abujensis]